MTLYPHCWSPGGEASKEGLRRERDLKRQREERKALGKLHVSYAAWATVMRTREGANGDQTAPGAGSQQPPPQLAERRAQRQDVGRKGPLSPPGPSLNLSWRRRTRWTVAGGREVAGGDERMSQAPRPGVPQAATQLARQQPAPGMGPSAQERPG